MTLHSDYPFVCAAPVVLRHSPRRKKLVLNLMLDALSWHAMQADNFRHIPNLMKFFQEGVIFNNAYSVAEHTYPAIASLATGMWMHHTHCLMGNPTEQVPPDVRTISEQMHSLGYYCANPMGCGRGLSNGATCGFDQLTINPYYIFTNFGVKYTLDHLDTFTDCDNYVFCHMENPHLYFVNNVHKGDRLWAQNHWRDACKIVKEEGGSPADIPSSPLRIEDNLYQIQRMDADLAPLFDYILSHYREDEFTVNAFSDHGVSIYEPGKSHVKDTQTSITMMCRGANVPHLGLVDELVSAIDLYAIMAHEAWFAVPSNNHDTNLPAAFGGHEREITFSNSIFPNLPYRLAMRTKDYECLMETQTLTRGDCTVDMGSYTMSVYTRRGERREVTDTAVRDYFTRQAMEFTRTFRRKPLPEELNKALHMD